MLANQLRPTEFENFIGNESAVEMVKSCLARRNPPHTYLISGPSGCGKTTLARLIAKQLNSYSPEASYNPDYTEMNTADFRGIDTARNLIRIVGLAPVKSPYRVFLFDECHKLTTDAQEALLKVLEEPPDHVIFILATTDPQKLLRTIFRRCIHIELQPNDERTIFKRLRYVCKDNNRAIDPKALRTIAERSHGSLGMALSLLDQVFDLEGEDIEVILAKEQELETQTIDLCRELMAKNNWINIAKILQGLKQQEPERVRRAVMAYCSTILLKGDNPKAALVMDCFRKPFYDNGMADLILSCYEVINGD